MFSLASLHETTWLVEPRSLRLLIERVSRIPTCPTARQLAKFRGKRLSEAKLAASRAIRTAKGKVGIVPVHGPIDQRMSSALMKLDGTSTEEIAAALDSLLADPQVDTIVFHVDSPGGGVYGVQELSDKIFAARQQKRTYAMADSMSASAAYWIASAAETFVVTPGGDVGSVGVYSVHVDESKALEAEGLSVTLVKAGKYKAELAPYSPLSEDAKGNLQSEVDYTYSKFLQAVKRNRNTSLDDVRANYGQGRLVNADAALSAKMVDRVMPFGELMSRLSGGGAAAGKSAALEVLRLRHEQRKRTHG